MDIEKIKEVVRRAAIYVPFDCEGVRIEYWDTEEQIAEEADDIRPYVGCFYGTGEESGEQYRIEYSDVDLNVDMFYEIKLIEVD